MTSLFEYMKELVRQGHVVISEHAYRRLIWRNIDLEIVIAGLENGTLLEDYSLSRSEPRILVRQRETGRYMIDVVWELSIDQGHEAVLITAFHSHE